MRRWVAFIAVCAAVAGVAAYLFYFAWDAPLLDPQAIDRYAYGPQGVNVLEYRIHTQAEEGATLERILALVNEATLTRETVQRDPQNLQVVLYRDDGLKYFLYLDGARAVGISEGDESYLGSLDSPELATLLREFEAKGDGLSSGG